MTASTLFWTEADQAELDVLLWALVNGFAEHRQRCLTCRPEPCPELEAWREHKARCRGCRGDAPLSYPRTDSCRDRHHAFVEHGQTCVAGCNPCRFLVRAIREVCEWREMRNLLSSAEHLRALQETAA